MSALQETIRGFAQETLGCGCPPEVFTDIEADARYLADDNSHVHRRIAIGGRLLIYVLESVQADEAPYLLRDYLYSGRQERDRMGFNRFRLVVACDDPEAARELYQPLFDHHDSVDERVHLHLLPQGAVEPLNLALD